NYAETLSGHPVAIWHVITGSRPWQRIVRSRRFARAAALLARITPGVRRLDKVPPFSAVAHALTVLADSDVPVSLCYPARFKGSSNWFIPNVACVRAWLEAVGCTLVWHELQDAGRHHMPDGQWFPNQRLRGVARKTGGVALEHEVRG